MSLSLDRELRSDGFNPRLVPLLQSSSYSFPHPDRIPTRKDPLSILLFKILTQNHKTTYDPAASQNAHSYTLTIPISRRQLRFKAMFTQTVYRFASRGSLDGLRSTQERIPVAGKYEVLDRVRSVALNFRDIAIAKDIFPLPVEKDLVPCSDMAGEVVQVGDQVGDFSVVDRVIDDPVSLSVLYGPVKDEDNSLGGSIDGVLRQYLVLAAHPTVKLPHSSHTFSDWAATVTTAYTVWNAFYGGVPLKPGQTVLLLGKKDSK